MENNLEIFYDILCQKQSLESLFVLLNSWFRGEFSF